MTNRITKRLYILLLICLAVSLLVGLNYRPARAAACTVHFFTTLGGGTNATYDLYSNPLSYIVYTGYMQEELPYWWGGPGIPGYGIAFEVTGGCSTLRVASATWHVAGDTGHYWEAWTGGSHNAEGDINATTQIPIDTDFAGYDFIAGNLAHGNPYDYVTFELYTTEGDPGPTPTATFTPSPTATPTVGPSPTATTPYATPMAGTCTTAWEWTDDFHESDQGWAPAATGQGQQDSSGYHTVVFSNGDGTWSQQLVIQRQVGRGDLPASTQVFKIVLDLDYNQGDAGTSDLRKINVMVGATPLTYYLPPGSGQKTIEWTGLYIGGTYQIVVFASGAFSNQGQANGSATVNRITLTGNGYMPDGHCKSYGPGPGPLLDWAYPVADGDQSAWPSNAQDSMLDLILNYQLWKSQILPFHFLSDDIPGGSNPDWFKMGLLFHTKDTQANVHAMFDGTVDSVTPLTDGTDACYPNDFNTLHTMMAPLPTRTCLLRLIALGDMLSEQSMALAIQDFYGLSYQNASLVVISHGTDKAYYLVADTTMSAGLAVTKGCIIGKALSVYQMKTAISISLPPALNGSWEKLDDGYAIVQIRDSSLVPYDLRPILRSEPQNIQCAPPPAASGGTCAYVRDPNLMLAGSDWQTNSGNQPEHDGSDQFGLWLKEDTFQFLNLDPTASYTIAVQGHVRSPGSSSFSLSLGATSSITITFSSPTSDTVNIDADTYLPTEGDGYKLLLSPTASTQQNLVIDFICVSDADAGPTQPAGGCLVINPEFDDATGWSVHDGGNGAAVIHPEYGRVWMPDASYIQQALHLWPKPGGPQDYTISVTAQFGGVPEVGDSISLDWEYGAVGSGSFGPFTEPTQASDSDTLTISSEHTEDLVLTVDASSTTLVLLLARVCVETADGAEPPGYQPGPPVVVTAQCKVCEYAPVGDLIYDTPMLAQWLLCGISQIWYCQMKSILYGIWQALVAVISLIAMIRKWIGDTANAGAIWLNSDIQVFAAWLNGQIANLETIITGIAASWGGGSGGTLWDALAAFFNGLFGTISTALTSLKDVLLALLGGLLTLALALVDLIGNIITLVFTLIMTLLNQAIALIQIFVQIIMTAINSPPVAPAGVPICDTGAEMIPENCLGIFIIDNTILADSSPLSVLLPLVEGIAGFSAIWWAVNKFRNALIE